MTKREIKQRITQIIRNLCFGGAARSFDVIPRSLTYGKLYEAYILARILEQLRQAEHYNIVLVNTNQLKLKSAPGPINRNYPRFDLLANGMAVASVWTDIEFTSLSCFRVENTANPSLGEYHELDIAVVDYGVYGRPTPDQIWLAAECKNTGYNKGLLKEILGIRRELSFVSDLNATRFRNWPRAQVPATPPSCLLAYSTSSGIQNYSAPGNFFGINFYYEPLTP